MTEVHVSLSLATVYFQFYSEEEDKLWKIQEKLLSATAFKKRLETRSQGGNDQKKKKSVPKKENAHTD